VLAPIFFFLASIQQQDQQESEATDNQKGCGNHIIPYKKLG